MVLSLNSSFAVSLLVTGVSVLTFIDCACIGCYIIRDLGWSVNYFMYTPGKRRSSACPRIHYNISRKAGTCRYRHSLHVVHQSGVENVLKSYHVHVLRTCRTCSSCHIAATAGVVMSTEPEPDAWSQDWGHHAAWDHTSDVRESGEWPAGQVAAKVFELS